MRRNTLLLALLGTGALVATAIVGQHYLMGEEPTLEPQPTAERIEPTKTPDASATEGAPTAEATSDGPRRLTVTTVGSLERLEGEEWRTLAAGAELAEDDRIRTSGDGTATLSTGDGSEIELVDEVEVSVEMLTRSLAELELHRGRLRADLSKNSGLSLRVRSSGATAEAASGAFVVYSDGAGMVAVASETANVKLRAQNEEVVVAAGQQAVVPAESPPGDPEQIPQDVFLRVAWPQRRVQREKRLVLRGEVRPGTAVRIGGKRAVVAGDGTFEARVELDAGPNKIIVQATDPVGRHRREESPSVTVKNRPPRLEVLSHGQWSKSD